MTGVNYHVLCAEIRPGSKARFSQRQTEQDFLAGRMTYFIGQFYSDYLIIIIILKSDLVRKQDFIAREKM